MKKIFYLGALLAMLGSMVLAGESRAAFYRPGTTGLYYYTPTIYRVADSLDDNNYSGPEFCKYCFFEKR